MCPRSCLELESLIKSGMYTSRMKKAPQRTNSKVLTGRTDKNNGRCAEDIYQSTDPTVPPRTGCPSFPASNRSMRQVGKGYLAIQVRASNLHSSSTAWNLALMSFPLKDALAAKLSHTYERPMDLHREAVSYRTTDEYSLRVLG